MIIVGELINASRKKIAAAIESGDFEFIAQVAKSQAEAGADYIDVNAGIFLEREPEYLKKLVTVVQEATNKPCSLDSPDPGAIQAALSVHQGAPMINSISLEKQRFEAVLPLIAGTEVKVVALCMSDEGMPKTVDQRLVIADKLVNALVKSGAALDHIFIDPLVQPISTEPEFGMSFLHAMEAILKNFPGVHTMCGLSNISYGLPVRKLLNRIFMAMAITKGLDGAIIDPTDKKMMAVIRTAEALAGRDDYSVAYIRAFRAGLLEE